MRERISFRKIAFFSLLIATIPLCIGCTYGLKQEDIDINYSQSPAEELYDYPLDIYHSISKDAITSYGICNDNISMYSNALNSPINIPKGAYVAIISNEKNNYSLIYYNTVALDLLTDHISFFSEDYSPDFSDSHWIGLDE